MFKLKSIELTDFGRHKKFKHVFNANLIGVVGKNRRGKSTLLRAIQLAATGMIDDPKNLNEFIRRGKDNPKKAVVSVVFEADGKEGTITRSILQSSTTRSLVWEGETHTADRKVTAIMQQILGVDKNAVNSTVFIRQGEMDKMFGKFAERQEFYAKLMMLGPLDKIADAVEKFRASWAAKVPDLSAVLDSQTAQYERAVTALSEATSALEATEDYGDSLHASLTLAQALDAEESAKRELDKANVAAMTGALVLPDGFTTPSDAVIGMHAKASAARTKIEQMLQAHQTYLTKLAASRTDTAHDEALTALTSRFSELDQLQGRLRMTNITLIPDPSMQLAQVKAVASAWGQIPAAREVYESWTATLAKHELQTPELTALAEETFESYQKAHTTYAQLVNDVAVLEKLAGEIKGVDFTCCPACGSSSPDSEYLTRTIAAKRQLLSDATIVSKEATEIKTKAAAAKSENISQVSQCQTLVTQAQKVLHDLLSATKGTDETQTKADVLTLTAKRDEWSLQKNAIVGLESLVNSITQQLKDCSRPGEQDVKAATERQTLSTKELEDAALNWNESMHAELAAAKSEEHRALAWVANWTTINQEVETKKESHAQAIKLIGERLSTLPGPLHKFFAERNAVQVSRDDVTEAAAFFKAANAEHEQAKGAMESSRKALLTASQAVTETELKIAEQEETRKLVKELTQIRDTFKPSGVAIRYLEHRFQRIAELTADYLAESNADFVVRVSGDEPLAFEFMGLDEPDEPWLSQDSASGGQKVRMAVATLLAIHALVMPGVGFLVLDEPSTHIDADSAKDMADMFRSVCESGVMQLVVCDHNPVVIDAVDETVQL